MPIVLCIYCEYIGSGNTIDKQWDDVVEHEQKKHPIELKEDSE